jgi:hypothetical protein
VDFSLLAIKRAKDEYTNESIERVLENSERSNRIKGLELESVEPELDLKHLHSRKKQKSGNHFPSHQFEVSGFGSTDRSFGKYIETVEKG